MKLATVLVPGLALLLGSPLLAAEVPGGNQALGQLDAIVNFCSSLDPALERAGQQRLAVILSRATSQELADARSSDEYRETYAAITAQLNGLEREQAARECKALSGSD